MSETEILSKFKITKTTNSRLKEFDQTNIQFGKIFADHMFEMNYRNGEWTDMEIKPYGPLSLAPSTSAIHYGQSIFEGLKAYRNLDDEVFIFRPEANSTRLNASAERMCMPSIPKELFLSALKQLVMIDKEWIPNVPGTSLYIRPFLFATDEFIGVKPSDNYKFMVFTCPVGTYYSEPVRVKIETMYSRACEGGVGRVKAAGNYAASLYPAKKAKEEGYHQLIWTDAKEHKYIEESGTMNMMFVVDNVLYTPTTSGTILPGITRDSVLKIAQSWGMQTNESSIHVEELVRALKGGRVQEAFGTGTAATIARIKTIGHEGTDYNLPAFTEKDFSIRILNYLEDLKRGREKDTWNWVTKIS
ncbi:MAG: branched-chain amino acid aminotransferase [Bacteroidetes bacterium]|jgi:branched-chain amino acid aminotransferase|nr:branched-chain amino acid aminotransferase [Bacteroidota bacterium]MDA0972735.1 branched-chain amino acid aminotransferase [Bacteroidota bacterium]